MISSKAAASDDGPWTEARILAEGRPIDFSSLGGAGIPFIWLTAELLGSDAWCDLGLRARRLLDLLMLKWLRDPVAANGELAVFPTDFASIGMVGEIEIAEVINEVVRSGLVDKTRENRNHFALNFMPRDDGKRTVPRWFKGT